MPWDDLDAPFVVVPPDAPFDPTILAGEPRVFIGYGRDVDVLVTGEDELHEVTTAVFAHPEAAIALAVLLRGAADRSVAEGLVAESATYAMLQGGADHRGWLDRRPHRPPATPSSRPPVAIERVGDVLHITLDRPDRRNAYDAATRDALFEALAVAAADAGVRVELRGNGPSFCAGGDLDEFGTMRDPAVADRIRLARSVGRAIAAVADRVAAHVHGACVGAGIELPSFAGRVVADPGATFWLPELSMGLVPGAGGTVSITRRIGRQRTALLALTGRRLDAPTAHAWGLVDELAPISTSRPREPRRA